MAKVKMKKPIDPEELKKGNDKAVAARVGGPIGKSEYLEGTTTEKGLYETQIPKMAKEAVGKKLSESEKKLQGIKLGFFTEREGNLIPTSKYQEYAKSGKLKEYGF